MIVHDAAGAWMSTTLTVANVDPVVMVPTDGMVTVLEPAGYSGGTVTVTKVQPGDTLEVPLFARDPSAGFTVDLTLSPHAGAGSYLIAGGCDGVGSYSVGGASGRPLGVHSGCLVSGDYALLALALAPGSDPIAWIAGNYPSTVTALSSSTTPSLPAWSTALDSFALSIDGVPGDVAFMQDEHALVIAGALPKALLAGPLTRSVNTAAQTLKVPIITNGRLMLHVRGVRTSDVVTVRKVGSSANAPGTFALTTTGIPVLSALVFDVSVPARPTLRWTRTGVVPDATIARFQRIDGDAWYVVVPPDASEGA